MTVPPLTPDELLTTTRSVRKRLDLTRPVPLDLVRECLEIALQAPSGSNRQGWHWLVVTDQEMRARIGELYRRSTEKYLAAPDPDATVGRSGPMDSDVQRRVRDSAAYLGQHMGEVPVHVIPCIRLDAPWPPGETQAGLWGSLLPAAWSYMLACRTRGLGTAWTTLHLVYEQQVAELLGLPGDVRQGALIPTAYYTGQTFRAAPRRPLEQVLHVNHW
jgi:nitroreductase